MAGGTPPKGSVGRRTLVGAAWATPVVLATTAAPAYAASCPSFVFPPMPGSLNSGNGWTSTTSPSGYMRGTEANNFISNGNGTGYSVVDDPTGLLALTTTITITVSVQVSLRNDRSYTFVWTYNKYGGNTRPLNCQFQINGSAQATGTMLSDSGPDYTNLTKTVTYAPTTAGLYTIAYVFTFPPSTSNVGDDMQVYSPVVTCG